ncbi:DNA-binding protein H-NS [Delftia acidovorans CCUG 274B]|nr:DNA-binding protein H-NS [Delftia acidovorans CCUG 274B]
MLDAKIANLLLSEKLDAIKTVRRLVEEHGLDIRDLFVNKKSARRVALYRNPKTGQTWAGLGRTPRWIEGQDRKPFEIF